MATKSKKKFKTEVQQLLDLVIHSLYSKKEIFLRELVSNASDACDRRRFESLQDKSLLNDDEELKIKISVDNEARTLTVSDNGIGMNREEVETNIGTIANSGTRRFLDEMKKADGQSAPELIGRFGVGFYAAFMVADAVTVITRRAGGDGSAVKWHSKGEGSYTLEDAERDSVGTDVILHVREDMTEHMDTWKIEKTIKQYSDYVSYPIVMDEIVDTTPTDDEGNPVEGAEKTTEVKEKKLNSQVALWKRPKSEISEEDYHNFYRAVSHDFQDPLDTIHYHAEGVTEFRALMFIPKKAPMDMMMQDGRKHGLQLYVRNVFITDECKELTPEYMRFVKGVVDSADLPLNVSREMLQDDAVIRRIRKSVVGKVISALTDIKENRPDEYKTFYEEIGHNTIKEGVHGDWDNREKLQELLMYESTATEPGSYVTLREYVDRMPEGQTDIYYLSGQNRDSVANSPHLEAFKSKGYEVLFFTDPIDEFVVPQMAAYDEKKFTAIDRGDIDLDAGDDDDAKKVKEEAQAAQKEQLAPVISFLQDHLKDSVKEVRLSSRLTESACVLVADPMGMNAQMERVMQAMGRDFQPSKRILELNPSHPIVGIMSGLVDKNAEDPRLADYADLLLDQALLTEGSAVKNPGRFAKLVSDLMVAAAK